ncbi:hypothetical protein EHW65_06650 [Erwinia psidii]|uniref:hypothetical protein n=1 Tax=Erwinia psidii TaxID=69224 RepID=UPI00226B1E7D|nr:hypothetical protein [Erwinia psidii]MCX8956965.1 hypothetical protein [Erwinia psidii]
MRIFVGHYHSLSLNQKSWDIVTDSGYKYVNHIGSFNYSWDEGDFHLIQLHDYPGMTGYDYNKTIISSDERKLYMRWDKELTWLKKSIEGAVSRGKYIIVNIHQPDGWEKEALRAIRTLFYQYKDNIKAVFAGHHHILYGYYENILSGMGGNIPVFLFGSASQQTYLIMESDDADLNLFIFLIKKNNWQAKN